jgi:peptidoglycan/LPS O-acetylase OafA/YrhL
VTHRQLVRTVGLFFAAGVLAIALGAALWIHPGAGLVVLGLGAFAVCGLLVTGADSLTEPTGSTDEEPT